jgi:hypothetical protein
VTDNWDALHHIFPIKRRCQWEKCTVSKDEPCRLWVDPQFLARMRQHPNVSSRTCPDEVDTAVLDALVRQGPFQSLNVTLDAAAETTRRRQEDRPVFCHLQYLAWE